MRIKIALVALAGATAALCAGLTSRADALANGLALHPPMGWNSYNHFSRNATASIVEAQARAMVSSGMKAAGYSYINLDAGWDLPDRDAQGELQPDPSKFPDGIAPVAAYVHSLGLKFGIYTTVGRYNCAFTAAGSGSDDANNPTEYYAGDAEQFASWGIDFVKVDWCGVMPIMAATGDTAEQLATQLYTAFGNAIAQASSIHPMVYSLSTNKPETQPWAWAPSVANMWRTTGDHVNSYAGMVTNFAGNVSHYQVAGPGAWNDPDIMQVGNGVLTATESRAEISLWAEMAAPLLAGNDLTTMSAATRAALINPDVIRVDQDRLARQGYPVASSNGHWVLTKPMANGARTVCLFNQTNRAAVISTTVRQVGLPAAPRYRVDHLWAHTYEFTTSRTISASVPAHAVWFMRVTAKGL